MSSDLEAPPEPVARLRPLAALSRVYAGLSGESNEKLWIQEVAWHEEPAKRSDSPVSISVSAVDSACCSQHSDSKPEPLFWPGNPLNPHIRLEYFRYYNRSVGLLLIFHHRNQGPPDGHAETV